jgi:hypothetical protein
MIHHSVSRGVLLPQVLALFPVGGIGAENGAVVRVRLFEVV